MLFFKEYNKSLFFILGLILGGCSIQIAGVNGAYQAHSYKTSSDVAMLSSSSNIITIINVDGKSVNKKSIVLKPGKHEVTLYIGKGNYVSKINHIVVLSADFKPGYSYFVKSKNYNAWIENSHGVKVSITISNMQVHKSIEL